MTKGNQEKNNKGEEKLYPCIANGEDRTKFEQFKSDSKYLQQPLLDELNNESDHFTNDSVQLLKFHGSYQQDDRENRRKGEGKDWQMMLRLRSPGGVVSPSLFVALNNLSNKLGNSTLRATTRQAFQMHGIRKESLKEVISTIIKSMGSTLAACGDINRNVMAPAAPFTKDGYPAARELAEKIAYILSPKKAEDTYLDLWVNGDLSYRIKSSKTDATIKSLQNKKGVFSGDKNEPLYGSTYLPRKFKCAVTVPGDNSVDLLTQDIGIVAFTSSKGRLQGCNVYVGGGMGRTHNAEQTFARTADPLGYIDAEHILELVQGIVALQRDFGNRRSRKNARMKYLIHYKGIKWFKQKLKAKYFNHAINPLRAEPKTKLLDYLGWHKQSNNIYFVGIPILSGRLEKKVKDKLADIVDKYQLVLNLTPNQDILLCNIGSYQRNSIEAELNNIGLGRPSEIEDIKRHALACPALPLCGLAITEAERALPDILARIKNQLNRLKINQSILVRMTGCPNGCARPYMAELALVGSGVDQYQLWLGGSSNLQRLAKPYLQKMSLKDMEFYLEPLFINWRSNAKTITFGDHINSIGDEVIYELLGTAKHLP